MKTGGRFYGSMFFLIFWIFNIWSPDSRAGDPHGKTYRMPERGLCAHRGAMDTHPENTLPAFMAAIEAGAHMIELDVCLTKDNQMVIMHDATVDRTTNGKGRVIDLTLEEIRNLDAGSWKSPAFTGVKVPLLEEVLDIMPVNIWLNIHLKQDENLSVMVARLVREKKRLHQAFLACGAKEAARARLEVPGIMICNMDRRENNLDYVKETIQMDADFIQLRQPLTPGFAEYAAMLNLAGVRVNFFGTDSPGEIRQLFEYGIHFPLVNNIVHTMQAAVDLNILPVVPEY